MSSKFRSFPSYTAATAKSEAEDRVVSPESESLAVITLRESGYKGCRGGRVVGRGACVAEAYPGRGQVRESGRAPRVVPPCQL